MSISKTVVRLSAAALVVAGGVGMVWAQSVVNTTSKDNASMKAGMTIQNLAEIDVIPKNPTGDDLKLTAAIDALPTATKFGSLGIVKVTTNSNKWDVGMTTRSGGRLLDTSSVTCTDVERLDGWGNPTGVFDNVCGGNPVYLRYGNTLDTVVLNVAIGLAKSGQALGNTGNKSTIYPAASASGGTVTFNAPVEVTATELEESDKGRANLTPALPVKAVSFAKTLGTPTWTGNFVNNILGDVTITGPTNNPIFVDKHQN